MQDLESYRAFQAEIDQSELESTENNTRIIDEVNKAQEGRDDNINALEVFTRQQIDLYKEHYNV